MVIDNSTHKVTIIVPVYGDWPSLKDCIESLKQYVNFNNHTVLLVNDCGPDVEQIEKNIKESISGHNGFLYLRNKTNLGFVKTCNRAVNELDKTSNDIMLLNSDTKVTPGFLEEMLKVLYIKKNHGVVSPRSNNATICTFPLYSIKNKGINKDKSYALFTKYKNKLSKYNEAPTAHGFCILIKRNLIKKYGLFDEIFGKGYGEEVDFCRRISKHGYKSIIANHAYVFHLEAKSFSLDTKLKLVEQSSKIINKRYPEYKKEVHDYIRASVKLENKLIKHIHILNITSKLKGLPRTFARS